MIFEGNPFRDEYLLSFFNESVNFCNYPARENRFSKQFPALSFGRKNRKSKKNIFQVTWYGASPKKKKTERRNIYKNVYLNFQTNKGPQS